MKERNNERFVAMSRVTSWVRARSSASSVGAKLARGLVLAYPQMKLDRIEFRCVGRQQVGAHTVLAGEPGPGRTLMVSAQSIPDEARSARARCVPDP
ncbi:MAG: hypothetical protein MZV65_37175 [Chromatiales bacterium]|nr:hypothetical protein [Chromatiales bacterium]